MNMNFPQPLYYICLNFYQFITMTKYLLPIITLFGSAIFLPFVCNADSSDEIISKRIRGMQNADLIMSQIKRSVVQKDFKQLNQKTVILKKLAKTSYIYEGGVGIPPELIALTLALSLYTATFIAECVRAGIQGVGKGQKEAAASIGLNPNQILKLVVMPQALRIIIPPTTNQYLNLTKNSSLAAAIAYPELVSVFAGTALNQTGQAVEIIFITMSIYLFLSLLTSFLMNTYNARVTLVEK